jgi:hypothetical protein
MFRINSQPFLPRRREIHRTKGVHIEINFSDRRVRLQRHARGTGGAEPSPAFPEKYFRLVTPWSCLISSKMTIPSTMGDRGKTAIVDATGLQTRSKTRPSFSSFSKLHNEPGEKRPPNSLI